MHSSLNIANYLIDKTEHPRLTPMQIIKLVYLCHGWMLGLYGRPLIKEDVEAWQYGPVIRELYRAVKGFRSKPVIGPLGKQSSDLDFDDKETSIINQVFDIYGGHTGIELSRLTHMTGSPWHKTWHAGGETISNDLIADYFRQLSRQHDEKAA